MHVETRLHILKKTWYCGDQGLCVNIQRMLITKTLMAAAPGPARGGLAQQLIVKLASPTGS